MTDGWTLAAQARNSFADLAEGLTEEQAANGSTLCTGWSPHVLTGHVVSFVDVPLPKFMLNALKHRGNFNNASDTLARRMAQRPMSDLIATLRNRAAKKSAIPTFPGELTASDVVIHGQDLRRGLDLEGAPAPELVQCALEFLTTGKQAKLLLDDKSVLDDLRFEATDLDWSHGSGKLVSGPGEAIMMTMTRRDISSELTGDGVATLVDRTIT